MLARPFSYCFLPEFLVFMHLLALSQSYDHGERVDVITRKFFHCSKTEGIHSLVVGDDQEEATQQVYCQPLLLQDLEDKKSKDSILVGDTMSLNYVAPERDINNRHPSMDTLYRVVEGSRLDIIHIRNP